MTAFDYAAWSAWLDAFSRGADQPTDHLGPMEQAIGAGAANRLADRSVEALSARLQLWSLRLQSDLDHSIRGQGLTGAEVALAGARSGLRPIHRFCTSSLLLPELADALHQGAEQFLGQLQSSLERSARQQPALGEDVLRVVRRTDLRAAFRALGTTLPDHPASPAPAPPAAPPPPSGPRVRRVLIGDPRASQ